MKEVGEINEAFKSFLKQEVIFEAQIRALQNLLSKKVNEPLSRAYLLHVLKILNKNLHQGKLTSEGKESAVSSLNPSGELIIPIQIKKIGKKGERQLKQVPGRNIEKEKKSKAKSSVKLVKEKKEKKLITRSKNKAITKRVLEESPTKEFLLKYSSITIREIADQLSLSVSTVQHLLKRQNLLKQEDEKLSTDELKGIYGFISSRLKASKRKEKAEKRVLSSGIKKANKGLNRSAGVYDKIQKTGGLGKVIYTGMKS